MGGIMAETDEPNQRSRLDLQYNQSLHQANNFVQETHK